MSSHYLVPGLKDNHGECHKAGGYLATAQSVLQKYNVTSIDIMVVGLGLSEIKSVSTPVLSILVLMLYILAHVLPRQVIRPALFYICLTSQISLKQMIKRPLIGLF